ncbi:hypothetical protein O7627_32430 [Solwaraspora sp. WMMD1047]|uniref:hypothetical protein n=1 Tax=Solwaraspora sp. WMMD1047 TaxID=3016102 RepID=UPI0024180849|nr:hypothetical protein [Solwaraspora sp. WMMD1047]MDG4833979.1 hypothetical protein [Solwaraspora sp. WMMD1047]
MSEVQEPNDLLRAARLRRSRSGAGPFSRQELANRLNGVLSALTGKEYTLDANYVGKLERGVIRWPHADYRQALRTILGAASDAELGLYLRQGR